MTRTHRSLLIVAACIALVVAGVVVLRWKSRLQVEPPPPCGVRCGTDRWSVKTLTDESAKRVSFTPKQTTVSWLVAQAPPAKLQQASRVSDIECQVWQVTGRLIAFKSEGDDGDYHLVIADLNSDSTMIVEIPDSNCAGVCDSPQRIQFDRARQAFSAAFGIPSERLHRLSNPVVVTLTGVGFFDRKHKQTGVAANGVELHPVIDLQPPDTVRRSFP